MATVFLARLSGVAGFQRLVAIKRLHPHLARETEFVEMFLDEARLAARIHHPNVVPIQEVGQSDRGYYLVMDYVEGDTLARMIGRAAQAGQTIPYGVIVRVLLDVLAGLHAAHELRDDLGQPLGIVHRDVSPQNILVGVDGVARLLDFGVARATSRLTTTRTGQLKGKLAYMAPEQAHGAAVDRRADVFACGIVLWEALTVKRLFKGEGEADTLNRVLFDPIAPPRSARADVPQALEEVCMRALERDIDKRYATAQELADDLERAGRALSCIGSVREVADCLQQVLGSELSQQREAVRARLTRGEPLAGSVRPPRPPESSTKIEGRREGSGSHGGPAPDVTRAMPSSRPEAPLASTSEPGGTFALAGASSPAPAGATSSEKVSSVSSTVLAVSAAPTSRSSALAARTAAVVSALVLLGVGAWGAKKMAVPRGGTGNTAPATPAADQVSAPSPSSVTGTAAPSAVSSASAPIASPSDVVAAPPPTGEPASSTKAAIPSAVRGAGIKTPPRRPEREDAKPATSAAPALPDDLSTNPYR